MVSLNFIFIGLLMVAAIVFAVSPLIIVALIAPRKRSRVKTDGYECGERPQGETWIRFRTQYYIYALMFILFDIESVFLFPWAVSYGGLGAFAFVEMLLFLGILFAGLIYAWAKGALRWS